MPWVELIGYVASVLVAGSLVMTSVVKLRLINLGGAVTFVVYGALIGAYPLVLTNGFIVFVNLWHLSRVFRADLNGFSYVPIDATRRHQLDDFVAAYREDILRYHPDFSLDFLDTAFDGHGQVYLALRNLRTEGFAYYVWFENLGAMPSDELTVLFAHVDEELYPGRSVYVPVDYVTRSFRDLGLVYKLHAQLLADVTPRARFILSVAEKSCRRTTRFLAASGYVRATETEELALYVKTLA